MSSKALAAPMKRGRNQLAPPSGVSPILTKASTSAASGVAKRMSAAIAIEAPIPAATPLRAAITGLGMLRSPVRIRSYSPRISSTAPSRLANSRTSAPAQKARPVPVTTTTRASGLRSASRTAAARAARSSPLTAFIDSGRLSRIQSTRFSKLVWTVWVATASLIASSPLENRLALLQEGLHALLLVLGREQEVEVLPLHGQALGQRGLQRLVDRLLGQTRRDRCPRGNLPRHLLGDLDRDLGRDHAVDQAQLVGPPGGDRLAGEVHLHRDV